MCKDHPGWGGPKGPPLGDHLHLWSNTWDIPRIQLKINLGFQKNKIRQGSPPARIQRRTFFFLYTFNPFFKNNEKQNVFAPPARSRLTNVYYIYFFNVFKVVRCFDHLFRFVQTVSMFSNFFYAWQTVSICLQRVRFFPTCFMFSNVLFFYLTNFTG